MVNELPVPGILPNVSSCVLASGDSLGSPCAMGGYHEQAIFDAACQRIFLSSPVPCMGANMNSRDIQPQYDMNLVLNLLQTCLRDDRPSF